MEKLLRLKPWQLFLLLIGVLVIAELVATVSVILNGDQELTAYFFPILLILFVGIFFGWLYTLGVNLHKKLPDTAPMNLSRFKIFLFIPVAYMLVICFYMPTAFSGFLTTVQFDPTIFALIMPLHLFSMFCIYYCLYFNAKALKTVELQRPLTFSDYAGEFFLIWLFPIGVWIIQPRINKLFDPALNNNIPVVE